MRRHLFHLGMLTSVMATSPAWGSSLLCSQIFEDAPGNVKIQDLLGRAQSSKITSSFKLQLTSVFQSIENSYGPLELKASTLGLNWKATKVEFMRKANELETSNDQYYLVADLLSRFNDGHVSIKIPSSLVFRLPLQLVSAEGRQYVNRITSEAFPAPRRAPLQGDEVVAINGLTTIEFQKLFTGWNAAGNDITNQALFGIRFGTWREERGLPLSKMKSDTVKLTLKSVKDGSLYDVEIPLAKEGTGLIGRDLDQKDPAPSTLSFRSTPVAKMRTKLRELPKTTVILNKFHRLFLAQKPDVDPVVRPQSRARADGNPGMQLGAVESFFKLPADFQRIQLRKEVGEDPLTKDLLPQGDLLAGTFKRDGKTVGFMRIPSYMPENLSGAVRNLRFLISELQKKSDYLVIDQTNNPGGMVVYSDLILKSLTGEFNDVAHMRFSVKPTQNFLRQFREIRDQLAQNDEGVFTAAELPAFLQKIDAEYQKIHDAFAQGKNLSEPVSMLIMTEFADRAISREMETVLDPAKGITLGMLMKHITGVDLSQNQVYKKPVYMMINELDFSGGDATPAGLQDYGRVKLVGTRTAGAGGTVESFQFRGLNEFEVQMTTSLMVRRNGKLVENYGVTPDIQVPLKGSDIADNFTTYFDRTMSAIVDDLNSSK